MFPETGACCSSFLSLCITCYGFLFGDGKSALSVGGTVFIPGAAGA
jgi:hypothetical protein